MFIGVTYEARARIAIWAGDDQAVEEYSRLTAREYRHGRGSPLAARYEQLMDEARQGGKDALPQLSEFESRLASPSSLFSRASATAMVTQAMRGAETNGERAERALTLIVDMYAAPDGHLYLFTEQELRLAASHGASAPPRGLDKFVKDFLDRCFFEPEDETGVLDEGTVQADTLLEFADQRGVKYQPVLLMSVAGEVLSYAGAAAVAVGDGAERRPDAELITALSVHLAAAGHVRKVSLRS
jgi:hypothetical protein